MVNWAIAKEMIFVDYTYMVEFLKDLKSNTYHLNDRQRMKMLLVVIGEHPDALSIIKNMGLIDLDMVNLLLSQGVNGYTIAQTIMNSIEIKTPSSDELSLSCFGYIKAITPSELNIYIDEVMERIEAQSMYSVKSIELEKEQEMALDEIEEFLK
jgi:hypothetical protein